MTDQFRKLEQPSFEQVKPLITEMAGLVFAADGRREKGGLNLTENEEKTLQEAFERQYKDGKFTGGAVLTDAVIRLLNNKSAVAWTTERTRRCRSAPPLTAPERNFSPT